MVSSFLGCKPESLKKSSPLQWKYRKYPMISLEQTWAFQYGKFSHIAGWPTPWPGWWFMGAAAWGSQDHIKAVLVGTACPCSKVRRINHPEQKKPSLFSVEWSYLEKLFLGKNTSVQEIFSVCWISQTIYQTQAGILVQSCQCCQHLPHLQPKPLIPCTHLSC